MHTVVRKRSGPPSTMRRAGVTVQVALSLTFIVGFAAMSVDLGSMYVAQSELQRGADSAAMAAASSLSATLDPDFEQTAKEMADHIAELNTVLSKSAGLDTENDVVFGRAVHNEDTDKFEFSPNAEPFDAVQVTMRRTAGSEGGPIRLMFARLFGHNTVDMTATATAMLVPRDMVVVIDISGSMTYDSQLRYYNRDDGGYPNTRDVWAAMDGPEPSRPYIPDIETDTEYAGDTGPTVGDMVNWGNPLNGPSYASGSDPGLWYIRKGQNTSNAQITANLTARGYNAEERTALMSGSIDPNNASHWQRRCGVLLGLANWKSGKPGGFAGGNGNNTLDSSEVTWIGYPSYRVNWTWQQFIDEQQTTSHQPGVFRYRYGLKTFVNWLLDKKREFDQTNCFWQTPQMPLVQVKDAVQSMVNVISAEDTLDHMSLVVFGTTAVMEKQLSADLQATPDTLYLRQAAHYDGTTNIGGGLQKAISELKSPRARPNANKLIVLMSDGVPNVGQNNEANDEAAGISWAYNQAQAAADEGFRIICVSVGYGVDRTVMQEIATLGNGIEYGAVGNPEEIMEELQAIFKSLGGKRPVQLIQ